MKTRSVLRSTTRDFAGAVEGFRQESSGSMTMFSLFMFVCMILIGGIAVDVMRFENVRAKMQNTMDRAVLAAADLDQTENPKVVVQDYLAKVGISIDQDDVIVTQSGSYPVITGRSVTANATIPMGTMFMHLFGVDELPAPAGSTAAEAINDIEISLVLDVSGSMGSPASKLQNMQDAAKDFATEIFDGAEPGRISLSVVPYSTQVSVGETLLNQWPATAEQTYSSCVDFETTDFNSTSISASGTDPLQRTGHFDPWASWNWAPDPVYRVCRTDAAFSIQPWSQSVPDIHNQIDGFFASGNTSIDVAVKWGTALLDPGSQSALNGMIAAGDVDAEFAGRPFAYDRDDTLKFLVVMTDGINTTQYMLDNAVKAGPSPYWRDPDDGDVSYGTNWNATLGEFEDYWYQDGRFWDTEPDGGSNDNDYRMDWPEVFARYSQRWLSYQLHYTQNWDANDYYDTYYSMIDWVNASTKDARLNSICTKAKNEDVIIFAVGFEVTDYSASVMENCASTPNHFYRVEGLDIKYAFASIANQINQLKLTQ